LQWGLVRALLVDFATYQYKNVYQVMDSSELYINVLLAALLFLALEPGEARFLSS
jgi:hypothetical protein